MNPGHLGNTVCDRETGVLFTPSRAATLARLATGERYTDDYTDTVTSG